MSGRAISPIANRVCGFTAAVCLPLMLGACGVGTRAGRDRTVATDPSATRTGLFAPPKPAPASPTPRMRPVKATVTPLPKPTALMGFEALPGSMQGVWRAAGRRVEGVPAVYETRLVPPGGSKPAGIAWMDMHLLAARLYSGSKSPGGGPYRYTAPVQPASAGSLVAAFNGGFMMKSAEGGYYTEGRIIAPLHFGAASLVIYADGSADVGAWGSDLRMTRQVIAVRQNLVPLVADGQPTPRARSADWQAWGSTCGASSCAASVPGIEHQWRSALGETSSGALVYAQGPALNPVQLADLLARAGAVNGMELDINPDWPLFATYDPTGKHGRATPSNGHLLTATVRGPDTIFDGRWARDFITLSAR